MKKRMLDLIYLCFFSVFLLTCSKTTTQPNPVTTDELVNFGHLNYLYIPVTFANGTKAAGVYIYSNAPDYHFVEASGEGFTCVDDVARAVLVYVRSNSFLSDTAMQSKVKNLIGFILAMQSSNGYFYNFLFSGGVINTSGGTSSNNPNWWSWRALQALTEAAPIIRNLDASLYGNMEAAVTKLIAQMKIDLVNLPQTTINIQGITVPQWLPAGSGTDQSAVIILGLIPYCMQTNDAVMSGYIKKLADGISLMQAGDSTHYPYGAFLSFENTWHAYGNVQAYALMKAGIFLGDPSYTSRAMAEVNYFYPWLIQNGFRASFSIAKNGDFYNQLTEQTYDQIAYNIEPMVFAATEAYNETGNEKYADLAGHLAAWFLGANNAGANMYNVDNGICYDGLSSPYQHQLQFRC